MGLWLNICPPLLWQYLHMRFIYVKRKKKCMNKNKNKNRRQNKICKNKNFPSLLSFPWLFIFIYYIYIYTVIIVNSFCILLWYLISGNSICIKPFVFHLSFTKGSSALELNLQHFLVILSITVSFLFFIFQDYFVFRSSIGYIHTHHISLAGFFLL